MATTSIEWTNKVWNPVTGCTKVSQGCKHCYAETIANRFWATQYPPNDDDTPRKFTDVRCHPGRLDEPLKWRKSARVFVNSMSDLFHEDVPDEFIDEVFAVMAWAKQHTFQVLTKRPRRMAEWMQRGFPLGAFEAYAESFLDGHPAWPLPNVWLGVSAENQQTADERIPWLLKTPAAARFVSAEPLLGPIDLDQSGVLGWARTSDNVRHGYTPVSKLDWVIVGGESGKGARPMHPDWARSLRDQCTAAGVPFFFKQWGAWVPSDEVPSSHAHYNAPRYAGSGSCVGKSDVSTGALMVRVGKKAAGRELDGREWNEFPGSRK